MIRTQIQLTPKQYERLKRLASERGVSLAQLVRDGVDELLARLDRDDRWERFLAVVGKFGDPAEVEEDVGREHDRHLEEIFGSWRRSS
ncbi:MAG: CopG family transcriptional regulator [Gemmatimonadota bacterium]